MSLFFWEFKSNNTLELLCQSRAHLNTSQALYVKKSQRLTKNQSIHSCANDIVYTWDEIKFMSSNVVVNDNKVKEMITVIMGINQASYEPYNHQDTLINNSRSTVYR